MILAKIPILIYLYSNAYYLGMQIFSNLLCTMYEKYLFYFLRILEPLRK